MVANNHKASVLKYKSDVQFFRCQGKWIPLSR